MKLRFLAAATVCVIAIAWSNDSVESAPDSRVSALGKTVQVIAHRGASAYAPENTLAAFALAAEMKAQWFELDCTLTKDGEVLVIHDDTIDRTTGGTGAVRDFTLAELKELEAGKWMDEKFDGEPLPTLGEALDLGKGRIGVYIEIKDSDNDRELWTKLEALSDSDGPLLPGKKDAVMALIEASGSRNLELTRKCIEAVRSRNMKGEIVIQSFSPVICAVALIEAPEMRTEFLASPNPKDPAQWEHFVLWERLLNAPGFNIHGRAATQELIDRLHNENKTLAVWTINDEARMEELITMGVDAIITNHPDICLAVIERIGN